jgi:antitoxin ParD1/3/4
VKLAEQTTLRLLQMGETHQGCIGLLIQTVTPASDKALIGPFAEHSCISYQLLIASFKAIFKTCETMPSSYVVGEHFERFIREQLDGGRYSSASEVVRDGLRLLEEQEQLRQLRILELRKAVEESRNDSRPPVEAEEVFERVKRKYAAKS